MGPLFLHFDQGSPGSRRSNRDRGGVQETIGGLFVVGGSDPTSDPRTLFEKRDEHPRIQNRGIVAALLDQDAQVDRPTAQRNRGCEDGNRKPSPLFPGQYRTSVGVGGWNSYQEKPKK